jgi:hypothetical protein
LVHLINQVMEFLVIITEIAAETIVKLMDLQELLLLHGNIAGGAGTSTGGQSPGGTGTRGSGGGGGGAQWNSPYGGNTIGGAGGAGQIIYRFLRVSP